jgi:hypothetical protein
MMYSRMTELIKQEEKWDVEGVWMINLIKSDYEHLLPSPLLPKMDDPGMSTIHRSINQRSFQRSCPQHENMHYSMSKMADQDNWLWENFVQNIPIKIQDCSWTPQDPRRTRRGDVSGIHKPSWKELTDKEEIKKIEKKYAQP